jgi:hypothetical protein
VTGEYFERSEVVSRRRQLAIPGTVPYVPMHPSMPDSEEYILPPATASRYYLPAYAQHILMELPEKEQRETTVKIYRLEHRSLTAASFIGIAAPGRRAGDPYKPGDPYHPTTFLPYFLGEFGFVQDSNDPDHKRMKVELIDPKDPMLYWLVPVVGDIGGTGSIDPKRKDYTDYFSVHAGAEFDWSTLR